MSPHTDLTSRGLDRDLVRAVAVLLAAVAQVVGGPIGPLLPGADDVAAVSDRWATLVTPAGYAFAIWGPIFAGCLAWSVYQLLPGQRTRDVHRRAGWPLAAAFTGNTVWELVFPQDGRWLLVANVVIVLVVVATAVALARLQQPLVTGLARVLPTAVAALLLGWVSIATVVNVSVSGLYLGAPAEGALARAAAVVALVAAAAIVLDVTLRLGSGAGPFAAAAAWGLAAVARAEPPLSVTLTAWVAVGIVSVGVLAQLWRTRRPLRVLLA